MTTETGIRLTQGEFFKLLRKRLKISIDEMAGALNWSVFNLAMAEVGKEKLTIKEIGMLMGSVSKVILEENTMKDIGRLLPLFFARDRYFLTVTNAEKINIWLRRNKMRQSEMAKKLKVDVTKVRYWVTNRSAPTEKLTKKIEELTEGFIKISEWEI